MDVTLKTFNPCLPLSLSRFLPLVFQFMWLKSWLCHGACVEVDSDTEAVMGRGFKLGCISCKMRGEVLASATVDWWFMAKGESEFAYVSMRPKTIPSCDINERYWPF
uniref:Uncharacterized protein n=1 Tax=Sinocyclocheilus grahami TaxID=75366 RepID=A0A672KNU1_SINGR